MCSTLPCPLCCQPNFPNVDSLRISLVNVTQRPLSCPICADVLLGLDKLTIHLFSHTLLDISNAPSDVQQHQQQSTIKSECDGPPSIAPSSQPPPTEIVTPSAAAALATEPLCDLCGFSFRNQELQQMHMSLVHEIDDDDDEVSTRIGLRKSPSSLLKNRQHHACHLCNKWFKMKGSLRVHLRVVHFFGLPPLTENCSGLSDELAATDRTSDEVTTSVDNLAAGGGSIDNNASSTATTTEQATFSVNAETKLWECDICAKSFTTKYFLKKHKRLHTGIHFSLRSQDFNNIYFICT